MPVRVSCHCGKIALTLDAEPTEAIECNCSMCRRKGSILFGTSKDKLSIRADPEAVGTYTFHKHVIQHHFCKTCGCAPYAEGEVNGAPMAMVNLRCAEDFDLDGLKIMKFDGANYL